jgi:CBS domain-containing protein
MANSCLYRSEVAVISANAAVEEAAKLMRDYHVGSVVVVESATGGALSPIGLLTDRDIVVEVIAEGVDVKKVSVRDIMSPNPVTARHTASLDELVKTMREAHVRRMPIVDDKNHLVGFVSFDDLLERVGLDLSTLSQLSKNQQKLEKEIRPRRVVRLT